MKEITLKIVTKKTIDFPMTRQQKIDFPTDFCREALFEEKKIIVQYETVRELGFNEKDFIELVKLRYKRTLDAHSVEVVDSWGKEIEG